MLDPSLVGLRFGSFGATLEFGGFVFSELKVLLGLGGRLLEFVKFHFGALSWLSVMRVKRVKTVPYALDYARYYTPKSKIRQPNETSGMGSQFAGARRAAAAHARPLLPGP
jgi:hypothetical protein